jgi:hypothetical protein
MGYYRCYGYYELPKVTVGYLRVTRRVAKSEHTVTGAGSDAGQAKERVCKTPDQGTGPTRCRDLQAARPHAAAAGNFN